MTGPFVPPDALAPAAPQAASVAHLFDVMLAISVVVFFVTMALLAYAVLRRRRDGEDPNDAAKSHVAERWVAIGGGITAAILVALVGASTSASRTLSAHPEGEQGALRIEVTGHQWWWEVRYTDPDPSKLFTLANEIHVPVGRPVQLILSSTDVIHSFWVPNMSGKKDLIPGRPNDLWITASREGIFRGQCAEFCGMEHARMGFRFVAESPRLFDAWVARQRKPAPEPSDPATARGRQVFLSAPCALCHTVSGTEAHGTNGPDLTHVASRLTLGAASLPNDLPHLTAWVVDAPSQKPGVQMPRVLIPADDLTALTAYLETLK